LGRISGLRLNALLPAIQDARTCRFRAWDFCRALFGDLVHMFKAIQAPQLDKESTERDITPQLPRTLIQQSQASLCDGHAAGEGGRLCARPPEWKEEKDNDVATGKTTWERDHDDWDIGDASDTTM
jgi:hypothetical protein